MVKGTKRCEKCHAPFADILNDLFSERYVPLVIVGMCRKHGGFFKSIAQGKVNLDEILTATKTKEDKKESAPALEFEDFANAARGDIWHWWWQFLPFVRCPG